MTAERTLFAKVAEADSGKIAGWLADRIWRIGWRVKRLKMVTRDATGHPRKLPPGSLAASCLREATSDDRFYMKGLQRYGPLFKLFWGSGDLKVCVIGLPLGQRLMRLCRPSLRPVSTDITPLVTAEYLRAMDPAIHPHYRHLFMGALRDDLVSAWEPVIRDIIRRELDGLASGAEAHQPPPAQLSMALNRIATRTLLLVVFGVRPESAIVPKLEALYLRMGPDGYVADVGSEQLAAFPEIRALVLQILQSMDDGSFSDGILRRLACRESGDAVDDTIIGNAIYMVERGRHDLRDLLRWVVKYLSDNLAVIAELRGNLARPGADPRLAEACVLETLRLDQAEVVNRKAMQSFEFDGYHIPKGSWVSILLRESHRDPANFAEPDRFRPQRFLETTYSADQYSPFGIDQHQCIGRFLVIRVGAIFVEELVGGFTWTVAGDGPRHYGHFHWRPSPSFAIDLKRNPAQA
jgi:cytochrome P450